jgi:Fe2+ or Zn2+ uptake regulation protein
MSKPASSGGQMADDGCPHEEREHGVCIECGQVDDGSGEVDKAMDQMEDR